MCHLCVSLQEDAEPRTGRPRSVRFNSLFSEDEFGDDHPSVPPAKYELGCPAVCRGCVCEADDVLSVCTGKVMYARATGCFCLCGGVSTGREHLCLAGQVSAQVRASCVCTAPQCAHTWANIGPVRGST